MKCTRDSRHTLLPAIIATLCTLVPAIAWAQSGYVAGKPEGSVSLGADSSRAAPAPVTPRPTPERQRAFQPQQRQQRQTFGQRRGGLQPRQPTLQQSRRSMQQIRRTVEQLRPAVQQLRQTIQARRQAAQPRETATRTQPHRWRSGRQTQQWVERTTPRRNRPTQRQTASRGGLFRARNVDSEPVVRNPQMTPWQQDTSKDNYVAGNSQDNPTLDGSDLGGDASPAAPAASQQQWTANPPADPFNPRHVVELIDKQIANALEQRELARERYEYGGGYDRDLNEYQAAQNRILALQDERISILRNHSQNPQALQQAENSYEMTRGLRQREYRGILDSRKPTEANLTRWLSNPNNVQ